MPVFKRSLVVINKNNFPSSFVHTEGFNYDECTTVGSFNNYYRNMYSFIYLLLAATKRGNMSFPYS